MPLPNEPGQPKKPVAPPAGGTAPQGANGNRPAPPAGKPPIRPASTPGQPAKPAGPAPARVPTPSTPPAAKAPPAKPAPPGAKPPIKPAPAKVGDGAPAQPPSKPDAPPRKPSEKPVVSARDHKPAPVKASTSSRSGTRRMGQVLVDLGYIDEDQLWEILDEGKNSGAPVGQVALQRGLITEAQLLQALAEQFGLRLLTAEELKPAPEALTLVPETMASVTKVVPLTYKDNILTVAVGDPVAGLPGLDTLRTFLGIQEVVACLAPPAVITEVLGRCYQGKEESIIDIINALQEDDDLSVRRNESSIDLDSLIEMQDAAPVRKLLNMVMLLAIKDRASDIHFEPFEDEYKIRMRCDGIMYEMVPPPRHLAMAISTRIKVMSNLDIAERRLPQDGRIELNVGGNSVDMRVSILPTMFGESAVIRVLDRGNVGLDLNRIGMEAQTLTQFRELIRKPNGITLITGPTGSGKTTTLYSALAELNEITDKIITCEDPVEYDIDGIIQVPINTDIGVTFANVLRSILRQDPDKILVGEIRDLETTQIAVQAALTGHMVFSTLHTNDAPSAIVRLRDMGLEAYLITATVEGIMAQRLVRRICEDCRTEFDPSDELLLELQLRRADVAGKKFYYGRGCDRCNNTGHKGRMGLFELILMNDELRDMISAGASTDQLRTACRKQGMMTLRESGLNAVFRGGSTIEEVVRETILEDD
jgi:type IV pilus assembly protein PilB